MHAVPYVLLALAAAGVVFVLVRGVITMASGKDITGRQSNKYMSYRVALQLLVVAIVLAIVFIGRR